MGTIKSESWEVVEAYKMRIERVIIVLSNEIGNIEDSLGENLGELNESVNELIIAYEDLIKHLSESVYH